MSINYCRKCAVELTYTNWYPYKMRTNRKICKLCADEEVKNWVSKHKEHYNELCRNSTRRLRHKNPEKSRLQSELGNRKRGVKPMSENKECSQYLGIYVAERVLSKVFENVERMPNRNQGFDFICSKGKKIDVKSACVNTRKHHANSWGFDIHHNKIADYFLCLAFDSRNDLNPLYMWLLPSDKFNSLSATRISITKINKWDEYKLDINKVTSCCNILKGE